LRLYNENGTKLNWANADSDGTAASIARSDLSQNTTYYVRLQQYVKSGSTTTYTLRLKCDIEKPQQTSIVDVTAKKKGFFVEFNPVSYADRYQIAYRLKGTSKWRKVTAKDSEKTIKKLKSKKKYQIRVRAQRKVNGKWLNGPWSDKGNCKDEVINAC